MSQKRYLVPVKVEGTLWVAVLAETRSDACAQVNAMDSAELVSRDTDNGVVSYVEDREDITESCSPYPYDLTRNQEQFCLDAEKEGFEIDFTYSGRGMYGKACPAVRLESTETFSTSANYTQDSMGLGTVLYARS